MAVKVLITGASGMLGRSLLRLLARHPEQYAVVGTALTRAAPPLLRRLDLLDPPPVIAALLDDVHPDVVVHCAAERDPDAFQQDPAAARRLNVDGTASLAAECARIGARLVYISTSYVFDGGAVTGVGPPYGPDAKTHPLNGYGESKLAGEVATRKVGGARAIVVRVPLLFGEDCTEPSESAALSTATALFGEGKAGAAVEVDDWALRFPTSVEDVSAVLRRMIDAAGAFSPGTYHVSSPEGVTKYGLARIQAEILGVEGASSRVRPGDGPPPGSAPRPRCTQLDCTKTWEALGGEEHRFSPLREAMDRAMRSCFPQKFATA